MLRRFLARVVTALVGSEDPVASLGQRADLMPPAEPGLGEAVQQDQRRAILGPRLGDVQGHPVRRDRCVPEISGHRSLRSSSTASVSQPLSQMCGRFGTITVNMRDLQVDHQGVGLFVLVAEVAVTQQDQPVHRAQVGGLAIEQAS